jgi:hypothetical protein
MRFTACPVEANLWLMAALIETTKCSYRVCKVNFDESVLASDAHEKNVKNYLLLHIKT